MQNLSCKNEFYLRDKKNHIHIDGFVLCISLEQRLGATRSPVSNREGLGTSRFVME